MPQSHPSCPKGADTYPFLGAAVANRQKTTFKKSLTPLIADFFNSIDLNVNAVDPKVKSIVLGREIAS
jgi:hypothetical protein